MPDNLEQLEKDWPQKPPKPLSPRGLIKLYLVSGAVCVAVACLDTILVALRAKSHHDEFWLFTGATRVLWLVLPPLWMIIAYRKIKVAVSNSGASQELLLVIESYGAQTLLWICVALMMILTIRL